MPGFKLIKNDLDRITKREAIIEYNKENGLAHIDWRIYCDHADVNYKCHCIERKGNSNFKKLFFGPPECINYTNPKGCYFQEVKAGGKLAYLDSHHQHMSLLLGNTLQKNDVSLQDQEETKDNIEKPETLNIDMLQKMFDEMPDHTPISESHKEPFYLDDVVNRCHQKIVDHYEILEIGDDVVLNIDLSDIDPNLPSEIMKVTLHNAIEIPNLENHIFHKIKFALLQRFKEDDSSYIMFMLKRYYEKKSNQMFGERKETNEKVKPKEEIIEENLNSGKRKMLL